MNIQLVNLFTKIRLSHAAEGSLNNYAVVFPGGNNAYNFTTRLPANFLISLFKKAKKS